MHPFLVVDSVLWRGPQPDERDLRYLKGKGLRSLVNTREESELSRSAAHKAGVNYFYLPVTDWSVPENHQVDQFFDIVDQADNHQVLVHCWGGVGRTGIFVSCYRVERLGMNIEEAIDLSDRETPHLQMSQLQRKWLRARFPA